MDTTDLATSIMQGNRRALARAITLVESSKPEHREQAHQLLRLIAPLTARDATWLWKGLLWISVALALISACQYVWRAHRSQGSSVVA